MCGLALWGARVASCSSDGDEYPAETDMNTSQCSQAPAHPPLARHKVLACLRSVGIHGLVSCGLQTLQQQSVGAHELVPALPLHTRIAITIAAIVAVVAAAAVTPAAATGAVPAVAAGCCACCEEPQWRVVEQPLIQRALPSYPAGADRAAGNTQCWADSLYPAVAHATGGSNCVTMVLLLLLGRIRSGLAVAAARLDTAQRTHSTRRTPPCALASQRLVNSVPYRQLWRRMHLYLQHASTSTPTATHPPTTLHIPGYAPWQRSAGTVAAAPTTAAPW